MSACSEAPTLVMFRGGLVAPFTVLSVLWQLEDRGARFELEADGGFRVIPASVLTVDDTAFLRRIATKRDACWSTRRTTPTCSAMRDQDRHRTKRQQAQASSA
jgi:hypothetical protein